MTFANGFFSKKSFVFWIRFYWSLIFRDWLIVGQYWLKWSLGSEQVTRDHLKHWGPNSPIHIICLTRSQCGEHVKRFPSHQSPVLVWKLLLKNSLKSLRGQGVKLKWICPWWIKDKFLCMKWGPYVFDRRFYWLTGVNFSITFLNLIYFYQSRYILIKYWS